MNTTTITDIDFSADFQTCYLTLSDGRKAEVPTTELTEHGEEVGRDGLYYDYTDASRPYRDEDGWLAQDNIRTCDIRERVEHDMADSPALLSIAMERLTPATV